VKQCTEERVFLHSLLELFIRMKYNREAVTVLELHVHAAFASWCSMTVVSVRFMNMSVQWLHTTRFVLIWCLDPASPLVAVSLTGVSLLVHPPHPAGGGLW